MIPPDANAAFVAALEDILDVYKRPRDAGRPLLCLDETAKQLIEETRAPIAALRVVELFNVLRLEALPVNGRAGA